MNIRIACPHCGGRTAVKTSRAVTRTVRDIYYACQGNVVCGFTFVAQLAIVATLSPSGMPRPGLNIPVSAQKMREANDNTPVPADVADAG